MSASGKAAPSLFTQEVAAIISGYLARRKREQRELAEAVGVSAAQMSRMLRGLKHWDVEQLDRACTFLDVSLVEVLREAESSSRPSDVGAAGDTAGTDLLEYVTPTELGQRDLGLAANHGADVADQPAVDELPDQEEPDADDARPGA